MEAKIKIHINSTSMGTITAKIISLFEVYKLKRSASKKAFSLIELLIVITIIGILAVALLPTITQGPSRARDLQRITAVSNVALAAELYYQDRGLYPSYTALTTLTSNTEPGQTLKSYFDDGTVPLDPQSPTKNIQYISACSGASFAVVAQMENPKVSDHYYTGVPAFNTTCKLSTVESSGTTTGAYYIIYND